MLSLRCQAACGPCLLPLLLLLLFAVSPQVATLSFRASNQRSVRDVHPADGSAVVHPQRVSAGGRFLSHAVHHAANVQHASGRRRRRSPELGGPSLHVRLPLPGAEPPLLLRLEPNGRLLAPGFVLERRIGFGLSPSYGVRNLTRISNPGCFYTGSLRGGNGSLALSTCNGLTGFVRTEREDYLVEPLEPPQGHDPQPHLVYKRSVSSGNVGAFPDEWLSRAQDGQQSSSFCATNGAALPAHSHGRFRAGPREHRQRRRSRRSVSLERNVETLLVADRTMVEYYSNEDLQTYLLTVLNMVSTLFHDASIGNAINVVLVRMILLEPEATQEEPLPTSEELDQLRVDESADGTLKSFCRWQRFVNPSDESHPNHHDLAILVTRFNMCAPGLELCSTLGLAEVAGMCQPQRSCNVNQDSGLTLAYTIAHEIGHNFGMSHDGPHNGCQAPAGLRQHVMAPHLSSDPSPLVWSNCSREEITRFLDRDWGSCLDDEPRAHQFTFPLLPPGAMYDADHQCRLQYGPAAEHCDGIEEVCRTLWCRLDNKCVTKMEPAAQGTVCDKNKWCYLGECTEMGERPEAIDGHWGPWSNWSECSRSCGGGVTVSERHCDHPRPAYGGRYCIGERKRYRMCNTQSCAEDAPSFRAVQCSQFNNVSYQGELFNWSPVSTPATPCQLHCKPDGKFFSRVLKESVTDGTPCSPGSRDVCINGKCRRVSCDWGIETSAREDRCGICHGDGTRCITVHKEFSQKEGIGYTEIGRVPKGARNIRVEELGASGNYLAVQGAADGEFFLNGDWLVQWSGEYAAAGTTLFYQRQGERDTLHAPGPTKQELVLYLLFQSANPGLKYEYTVPELNASRRPEFHWRWSDWSPCTVTCGGGSQESQPRCFEKEAGLVEDTHCDPASRPATRRRPCSRQPCPARWWTGPWQPCSATCGGVRRHTVLCVRSRGKADQLALRQEACDPATKPNDTEPCPDDPRCPGAVRNNGTAATAQPEVCGQDRPDLCATTETTVVATAAPCSSGDAANDSSDGVCDSRSSDAPPRPTASVVDIQSNTVLDIPLGDAPGDFWNLSGISGLPQILDLPVPRKVVVLEDARYAWRASKWSKCSRLCGGGERHRRVKCVDKVTQKEVPQKSCLLHTPQHLKPPEKSPCNIDPCVQWQTSEWSRCSVKCGPGTRQREVSCPLRDRCDPARRPSNSSACNRGPCHDSTPSTRLVP
ncbi:hypothetical protein MRX96_047329 [Rhipicephalus microplus]